MLKHKSLLYPGGNTISPHHTPKIHFLARKENISPEILATQQPPLQILPMELSIFSLWYISSEIFFSLAKKYILGVWRGADGVAPV